MQHATAMLTGNYHEEDLSPRAVCHPSNISSPTSPTYTSHSAPSPYPSSSSASYQTRRPVSEPFESVHDLAHHHQPASMDSYPNGYGSLSHSSYNELEYPQVDYTLAHWPSSDVTLATKRHPPSQHSSLHPQQFQHHTHAAYPAGPPHAVQTADFDRVKSSELYISPTSPTIFHLSSPGDIHSPIPVASSSYHPSPSTSTSLPAPHLPHPLRRVSQQDDCYFPLDTSNDQWRPDSTDTHHAQYSTIYSKSQSHPLRQSYPASGFASQAHANLMADYSSAVDVSVRSAVTARRIKQEEMEIYAAAISHTDHHIRPQTFDLGVSRTEHSGTGAQHASSSSSMSPYFALTGPCGSASASPDLNLSALHIQDGQVYAATVIPAAAPSSSSSHALGPSRSGFEALQVGETPRSEAYTRETAPQDTDGHPRYTPVESEYMDQFNMSRHAGSKEMWRAMPTEDGEYAHGVAADPDEDAEGEDDSDGYASSHSHYTVHQDPCTPSPDLRRKILQTSRSAVIKEEEDADEQEDVWQERSATGSEGDLREDERDPDFVPSTTRPRRHTYTSSSSYTRVEGGRNLRSASRARYTPYPSNPPIPRTGESSFSVTDSNTGTTTHHDLRPRRGSYSHLHTRTSVSPSSQNSQASEPYSPLSTGSCPALPLGSPSTSSFSLSPTSATHTALKSTSVQQQQQRRRVGPHAGAGSLPIPVPVPNLTKKSRGRRVPTLEDLQLPVEEWPVSATRRKVSGGSGSGGGGGGKTGMRTYTCGVGGCGKLFARGEHLKRHIRSIHTYEKRALSFLCFGFFFSVDPWLT